MIKRLLLLLLMGAPVACASDYFVDCNYGANGNTGTQTAASLADAAAGGDLQLSARRHDQLAAGLYLE